MENEPQLGIMFSNWYSGATLFAILLNNHENITCNGETFPFAAEDIGRYRCSCGKPLIECAFYRSVCSHMLVDEGKAWNKDLFVTEPRLSRHSLVNKALNGVRYPYSVRHWVTGTVPSFRKKSRDFIDAHHRFFRSCCRREGSSIYIDGTKSIRRAELTVQRYVPVPKVVHLVRDGRGFCASYLKHYRLQEDALPRVARAWNKHIRLIEAFLRNNPGVSRLTVRYEDLCRDLSGVMKKVTDHFGIGAAGPYVYRPGIEYHILGNKMRKEYDGTVTEDQSWRTKLSGDNIRVITEIMEKYMAAYGYL